ncbi:MAG TPA: hotdog fold domain-containing protein [Steroidobacteraceae bacterium]|nr:hotdog fold domain-containing protein [Steroidobacteraceae bacterium]
MPTLSIDARYCGPPGHAHGGYLAGTLANHSDRQLRVRLLQPTPLARALQLQPREDGSVELSEGERLLVRGEPVTQALQLAVPAPPGHMQAIEASRRFIGFKDHAFPNCFACGTARARGDGLRIFAGSLDAAAGAAAAQVAAPWTPDAAVADADGKIRPEFIAAALDCPGYFAARSDGVPMLLGEFTVHIDRLVHVDEPCVVIGWRIGVEGRKYRVGTALFDEDGELCARAFGLWIEPRGSMPR